jgi:hypothetical protein
MPGELIAQGRAADVFAAGPGRVLRRYREGEGGDAYRRFTRGVARSSPLSPLHGKRRGEV